MTVTVRFARTAEQDILNASIWWRVNRTASPDLFDRELVNDARQLLEFVGFKRHRRIGTQASPVLPAKNLIGRKR